jgi:hypothetical protein
MFGLRVNFLIVTSKNSFLVAYYFMHCLGNCGTHFSQLPTLSMESRERDVGDDVGMNGLGSCLTTPSRYCEE